MTLTAKHVRDTTFNFEPQIKYHVPLPAPTQLFAIHFGVPAVLLYQLLVAAVFNNSAALQHQNPVCHLDGGEAVADDK